MTLVPTAEAGTAHIRWDLTTDPEPLPVIGRWVETDRRILPAVALEDGAWHHERSYAPERADRPETVALWHKISTVEHPEWTRRYHSPDPKEKAFGGRVIVTLQNGTVIEDELAVADAHPLGARPFTRPDYVRKFRTLAEGIAATNEQDRFIACVERLMELKPEELAGLTLTVDPDRLGPTAATS